MTSNGWHKNDMRSAEQARNRIENMAFVGWIYMQYESVYAAETKPSGTPRATSPVVPM